MNAFAPFPLECQTKTPTPRIAWPPRRSQLVLPGLVASLFAPVLAITAAALAAGCFASAAVTFCTFASVLLLIVVVDITALARIQRYRPLVYGGKSAACATVVALGWLALATFAAFNFHGC